MRHTPQNLPFHNLVGLDVEILEHPNVKLRGLKGRVVDETKNTLLIDTGKKRVRVLKDGILLFTLPDGTKVRIYGEKIKGRPWDRLKKFK